jgi:type IV secretion system protein TrbL
VAVAAAAIGAAVTLGVTDASSPPSSSGSNSPGGSSGVGNGSGMSPGGGGGMSLGKSGNGSGSGARVALIIGKVTAVNSTSITYSTNQGSSTAAVTSSTTFSGKVTNIGQVKVGDEVMIQQSANANGGDITATSIEDPASTP